jgi:hypothetical protein
MTQTQFLANYLTLRQSQVQKYLPLPEFYRPLRAFDILLLVKTYPGNTAGYYQQLINSFNQTFPKYLSILTNLNYIKKRSRKRFVGQIGKWKPEDVYNISPKGERVLSEILRGLEGEKIGANHV